MKTKITKLFLYSNLGFALLGQVLGTRFGPIDGGFEGWMRDNPNPNPKTAFFKKKKIDPNPDPDPAFYCHPSQLGVRVRIPAA